MRARIFNAFVMTSTTLTHRVYCEEQGYLDAIRDILDYGETRPDRTGVGTKSLFGLVFRYSLEDDRVPVFSTKRIFFRGVLEELLWLISGSTDSKVLAAKRVHFWDANGSRAFLDTCGLTTNREGDLGPIYGHQWRRYGATYMGADATADDYTGDNTGVDQLAYVVDKLRNDPYCRRIIMSAWNPVDMPKMAVPPCHSFVQFSATMDGGLRCQLTQRSGDICLGVPFNVASYALLTHILGRLTGLRPTELVHVVTDAHVYLSHVEHAREQLTRVPKPSPKLRLRSDEDAGYFASDASGNSTTAVTNNTTTRTIDDFTVDDFTLVDYTNDAKIAYPMAL